MRAMQISQFGSSDEFTLNEIDPPSPKAGEVVLKVHATSVNPLDYKLREGAFPDLIQNFPMTLHGDVAGTITEVSNDVTEFKVGDEVYGCVGGLLDMPGALQEYVACDAKLIAKKPASLSLTEAAAMPLVVETAWEGLFNKAGIKPGQTVLVYGGTGGVGHIAALIAKAHGCEVTVTVSSNSKAELVRTKLGIEQFTNYKEESLEACKERLTQGQGFDVVFDTVGGDNLNVAIEAVAPNGHVLTTIPNGAYDLSQAFMKNASLHTVFQPLPLITGQAREKYHQLLSDAAKFIDQHGLKPLLDDSSFKLEEAAKAHQHLESGAALGKVVVLI